MDGKTILNLAAAIRARIAPGDGIDLYIPARELELKTINFDEEDLEILEAWGAGELKPADEMSDLLKEEQTARVVVPQTKNQNSNRRQLKINLLT